MDFRCSPMEVFLDDEELENWLYHKSEFCRTSNIQPHRALNDAIIIAETLERRMIPALDRATIATADMGIIEHKSQAIKQRSVA